MERPTLKQILILLAHALVLWMLCGGTMAVCMSVLPLQTALIVHAIAAPIYAILISILYFRLFAHVKPLTVAAVFLGVIVVLDFFLVALAIKKSLDMFTSFIGTWLPFMLIFTATLSTSFICKRYGKK